MKKKKNPYSTLELLSKFLSFKFYAETANQRWEIAHLLEPLPHLLRWAGTKSSKKTTSSVLPIWPKRKFCNERSEEFLRFIISIPIIIIKNLEGKVPITRRHEHIIYVFQNMTEHEHIIYMFQNMTEHEHIIYVFQNMTEHEHIIMCSQNMTEHEHIIMCSQNMGEHEHINYLFHVPLKPAGLRLDSREGALRRRGRGRRGRRRRWCALATVTINTAAAGRALSL